MRSISVGMLVAVALTASACHTMKPLNWNELDVIRPSRAWVTQEDQSVVEMTGPRVFGDTVVGYIGGEFTELPTASVQKVTVRRLARGKTLGLIAASTAAAAGIAVWMSGSGQATRKQFLDCADVPDDPDCI